MAAPDSGDHPVSGIPPGSGIAGSSSPFQCVLASGRHVAPNREDASSDSALCSAGPLAPDRAALLERLLEEAESFSGAQPAIVCIVGPDGSGKTDLTHRWIARLRDSGRKVLSYSTQPAPTGGFLRDLAENVCRELSSLLGEGAQPKADFVRPLGQLWAQVAQGLRQLGLGAVLWLVIDGLEDFESTELVRSTAFLRDLAAGPTYLLITCAPGPMADAVAQLPTARLVEIPPLRVEGAQEILRWIWEIYGLELPPAVAELLTGKGVPVYEPAWRLPLWVELAGRYLASEASRASSQSAGAAAGKSTQGVEREAERLPPAIEPLCWYILERCEEAFGRGWIQACLGLLSLSRRGLRETDLAAVVPKAARLLEPTARRRNWEAGFWDNLTQLLPGWFTLRPGWRTWDFSHKLLRQAVVNRYLRDLQVRQRLHLFLAYHLQTLPEEDPLRRYELLFHLVKADDRARAAALLSNLPVGAEKLAVLLPLEHCIVTQAEEVPNPALSWLASLLLEPTLKPEQTASLCLFFHQDLIPWIQDQLDLISVRKLLEAARQSLSELLRLQPDRSDWAEQYQAIGEKLRSLG
ncbi:MAG: ATP-binding protein [Thermoguttaceae bacterium]|nr:ATP-binding protein [Thermoguttaceae bacterium]MDW8077635.1 ATP-binding protein [Thermoguttaceae bacterium]